MPGRSAHSRERAVETAASLFQKQGYAATGLTQVIEESGSPKGSFYFNFAGGKEELAESALVLSGERLLGAIEALAERSRSPAGFARSLVKALAAGLEASDFERGCPIAPVALETAATSPALREASREQFARWEEAIARGLAPDGRPAVRHRKRAAQALMLLEGALLMGRVQRSTAPLRSAEDALVALVADD